MNDVEVAKMLQDLNMVLSHHVCNSDFLASLLSTNGDLTHPIVERSLLNPIEYIEEVVSKLLMIKSNLQKETPQTLCCRREEPVEAAVHEDIHSREEQGFIEDLPEDDVTNNWNGDTNDYPTPEQHSHLPWPPCVGVKGFRSVLCSTCATFNPPMWKHQLELADFCIATGDINKEDNL